MSHAPEIVEDRYAAAVRRYYRMVDSGDIEGIAALFSETGTYHRPGFPDLIGRKEIKHFFAEVRIIASGDHSLTRLTCSDRIVTAEGTFQGTLKDGSQAFARFADIWEFGTDGLATSRSTYFDAPLI